MGTSCSSQMYIIRKVWLPRGRICSFDGRFGGTASDGSRKLDWRRTSSKPPADMRGLRRIQRLIREFPALSAVRQVSPL